MTLCDKPAKLSHMTTNTTSSNATSRRLISAVTPAVIAKLVHEYFARCEIFVGSIYDLIDHVADEADVTIPPGVAAKAAAIVKAR